MRSWLVLRYLREIRRAATSWFFLPSSRVMNDRAQALRWVPRRLFPGVHEETERVNESMPPGIVDRILEERLAERRDNLKDQDETER